MKTILPVSDPNVYARFLGAPVLHPLVNVIHYDEVSPIHSSLNRYGVYGLFIQRNFPKNLTYGMKMFENGSGSPDERVSLLLLFCHGNPEDGALGMGTDHAAPFTAPA